MKEIIYKKGLIEMKIKQALASKSLGQSSYILILLTVFSMTLFLVSLTLNLPGFMGIKAASADSLNLTGNWSTEAQVVSGPYLGSGFSGSMILSQSGTNLTGTFSSSQYSGACSGTYSNGTMSLLGVTTIGYSLQVTATVTGTGQQIQGTWTDNLGDSGIYSASKVATSGSGTGAVAKIQAFWQWDTDFIQEPVDSATGAHQLERALLTCHGVQDLDFKIQYNSLLLNKDALGNGWSHNYEAYLDILNGGGIRIHWNANYSNLFNTTGNGQFTSTDLPTEYDRLVKNANGSYTLTRKDQSVYQFNSSGQLTKIQNGHGQELDLIYNSSNKLKSITEPVSGQAFNISYNSNNLISTVTDSLGRQVSFTYDANSNLTEVIDANGNKTTYAYTSQGYIQSGADNNGLTLFTDTYDKRPGYLSVGRRTGPPAGPVQL